MTDYRAREGRLERENPGSGDPVAMVHLRCTNCGYGRMRRPRFPGNGEGGFLHQCDLCGYLEVVNGLYPRPVWPWDAEAYQQPVIRETTP